VTLQQSCSARFQRESISSKSIRAHEIPVPSSGVDSVMVKATWNSGKTSFFTYLIGAIFKRRRLPQQIVFLLPILEGSTNKEDEQSLGNLSRSTIRLRHVGK